MTSGVPTTSWSPTWTGVADAARPPRPTSTPTTALVASTAVYRIYDLRQSPRRAVTAFVGRRRPLVIRQDGRVIQRPAGGTIPDTPGSYQFKDGQGRVIYVGKAKSLRSRLSNYFQNPANLPARTAQMVATAETRRVDPGPQRRRSAHARVQPHQAAPAPLQHPAAATTRATRSWPSPSTTSGPGPWSCAAPSARACATSGPTATPTPSARRSTCCCARSPSAPARTTSWAATRSWAAPACCSTSRSARARAWARSTGPPTTCWCGELIDFLDGDTDAIVDRLETADARGGRRARVRAGRPAARPARRGAQGHRQAADGGGQAPRTST